MHPITAIKTSLALLFATSLHAGPRTSASYSIVTDSNDAGGSRSSSASYTHDGSAGGSTGISTSIAPAQTVKHGYVGQLTEVTALQLAASPATVNEMSTRQLSAVQILDDLTTTAVPAASIAWSMQGGPLSSISSGGLVTATSVYRHEIAVAQGIYAGVLGLIGLTVLDTVPDNFGTYAADGLGDDWQVQYFGLSNPNAAPLMDVDHDGHTNLFEFTAGIVPTDPASKFDLRIEPVPGFPTQKRITFSPRLSTRTYTVKAATTLAVGTVWIPLTGSTTSDAGDVRAVTDTTATGTAKFYQVQIVKP